MASDSPSPHGARSRNVCPPSPTISPAQAIADAWKRESMENQEKWKRIDADVKTRFNAPRKPGRKTKM
ncbi:hypothetical protein B0H34DRAFT_697784 [Crassisporium funariophilum]|nr:hypothetical protein B0H34DRAFT_697784 [Crassisporium funariophilum]